MKNIHSLIQIDWKEWLENLPEEEKDSFSKIPYYNGGWVKKVEGINKKYQNGYSIEGAFLEKEGMFYYDKGLYLICSIGGSRGHQTKHYYLVKLEKEKPELIKHIIDGRDWAVRLWEDIEKNLTEKDKKEIIKENTKDEEEKGNIKEEVEKLIKKYGKREVLKIAYNYQEED